VRRDVIIVRVGYGAQALAVVKQRRRIPLSVAERHRAARRYPGSHSSAL
jgi:hypothetical protein